MSFADDVTKGVASQEVFIEWGIFRIICTCLTPCVRFEQKHFRATPTNT